MNLFVVVGAFLLTVGLILMAHRWIRRLGEIRVARQAGLPFELIARIPVGLQQGIGLVRVGRRIIVVGLGEGGVRYLTEVSDEDAAPVLEAREITPTARFADLVRARIASRLVRDEAAEAEKAEGTTASNEEDSRVGAIRALGIAFAALSALTLVPDAALAQSIPTFDLMVGQGGGGQPLHISGPVGIVLVMGLLALLPTLILLATSFTRIVIVLHLLRQALGTQTAPPTMLLGAMALMLTGFVMMPVLNEAHEQAIRPYLAGEISQTEAFERGVKPFREFMAKHTREEDLALFIDLAQIEEPETIDDVPTLVLMSAFVASELRTAFLIGFVLFLPFLAIDVIVSSILVALGVFMLPPVYVSLPIKLLLFVIADGWFLLFQSLVQGYAAL